MPLLYIVILVILAVLGCAGEALDRPILCRISGPVFALLLSAFVAGIAG